MTSTYVYPNFNREDGTPVPQQAEVICMSTEPCGGASKQLRQPFPSLTQVDLGLTIILLLYQAVRRTREWATAL